MKKFHINFYILAFSSLLFALLCGCTKEVIYDRSDLPEGVLIIDSYPAGFQKINSRTSKTPFEYSMSNKCMFVFDSNGNLIKKEFKQGGDVSFLLDRNKPPFSKYNQDLLKTSKLYIVSNLLESDLKNAQTGTDIQTENELLNITVKANKSSIHLDKLSNFLGLPMIGGAQDVDLSMSQDPKDLKPIAPIILRTLYAKIVVDIQLNIEQDVPGHIPTFKLNNWKVHNLPGYTTLGATPDTDETKFIKDKSSDFVPHAGESKLSQGSNLITNGGKHMVFDFYALEHRVNVRSTIDTTQIYPEGIKLNQKQRYKPNLMEADQKPMYIEMDGVYTDHQGHDKIIKYLLYLGENSRNNFHINRNCLIQNNVSIKGITNYQGNGDSQSVSIDNRVNIDQSNEEFIIKVERETMLDSHIEIRPIDIELTKMGDGHKVVVEIIGPDDNAITKEQYPWVRFEKKNTATAEEMEGKYCSSGKRKYFTTSLLTELKETGFNTTITDNEDNRIWIYFDETDQVSVDGMRDVTLRFTYYEASIPKKIVNYKFRQHDLYPVSFKDAKGTKRDYYIEFYEEYLYNFDPKDPYTSTREGMEWGQMDVEYSDQTNAIEISDKEDWGYIVECIRKYGGKYDYTDNYKGKEYTLKLIQKGSTSNGSKPYFKLRLDEVPRSAAEYCYNKNKRNDDGTIAAENFNWYLPAIGEIQGLTTTAYTKFKVFQEQFYWSSQTSYLPGSYKYEKWLGLGNTITGDFNYEDKEYARATKTYLDTSGKHQYVQSESYGKGKEGRALKLLMNYFHGGLKGTEPKREYGKLNVDFIRDEGNKMRNSILRVRAVRQAPPQE